MTLHVEVIPGSGEPIYAQIGAQIRRAVASGRLGEGDQLPPVRTLAEQLTVNPNTVARAYSELTAEGLLESQAGRGVFIARRRQMLSAKERERRLDEAIRRFLNDTAFLDLTLHHIIKRLETLASAYSKKTPKP
jgi:GntR family transcriptional regulator